MSLYEGNHDVCNLCDTIIVGPDSVEIENMITSLGTAKEGHRHIFELRDEGEVFLFRYLHC